MDSTHSHHQQPNDAEPSAARKQELERAFAENAEKYAGIQIRTRGELLWILQTRGWSGDVDAEAMSRAHLHGVDLRECVLGDIALNGANLQEARLSKTDLRGASLFMANLSNADLRYANLRDAFLPNADLSNADFEHANLSGAHLLEANLVGAYLEGTDLSAADLWGSRMDVTTVLRGVTITQDTRLGDIVWNGVPLTQINWTTLDRLGDESLIAEVRTRWKTSKDRTARSYRSLGMALRQQGLTDEASVFHLREQRLERSALRAERHYGRWIFSSLLNAISGYGEKPSRAILAYALVILTFTGIYYFVTHYLETKLSRLSLDEALVLSLTSFHGRGFFPGTLPLGDWVARCGAIEAIIGLFIELIFIATFSRRFLGN